VKEWSFVIRRLSLTGLLRAPPAGMVGDFLLTLSRQQPITGT
jgi:hypothetical protein